MLQGIVNEPLQMALIIQLCRTLAIWSLLFFREGRNYAIGFFDSPIHVLTFGGN